MIPGAVEVRALRRPAAWSLPVRPVDVCLLSLALVIASVFVGPGLYTVDESAYRTQAAWVDRDGTWVVTSRVPDLGPGPEPAPLALSTLTEGGWAPYGRAPVYVGLLVASRQAHPLWGPVALSAVGLVALATLVGCCSEQLSARSGRTGFWLAAAGTPFLVHAHIVWAHTLAGAAAASALFGLVLALHDRRRSMAVALLVFSVSAAIMLRTEGLLFGAAVTTVLAVDFLVTRKAPARRAAVAAGIGTLGGYAINWSLVSMTMGGSTATHGLSGDGGLAARLESSWNNLLAPGLSGDPAVLGRVIAVLLLGFVASQLRDPDRSRRPLAAILLAAIVVGSWGAMVDAPYQALLPAAPLLVVGTLLAARVDVAPTGRRLLFVAAVFATAVVFASDAEGGGFGWGGRYVMLAAVIVAPVAACALHAVVMRRQPMELALVVSAVLITVLIQLNGIAMLRNTHAQSLTVIPLLEADVQALSQREGLLVTTDIRVGRVAPEQARDLPLLSVPAEELLPLLDRIEAVGLAPPLLVGTGDNPPVSPGGGWHLGPHEDMDILVVAPLFR